MAPTGKIVHVLISFLTFHKVVSGCQLGFVTYDVYCYGLLPVQVTWAEALTVCKAAGSELATIDSAEEQIFVDGFLQRSNGAITTPEVWLAGTDMLQEGTWRWADSMDEIVYTKWAPGEPDDIGHNGMHAHCLGLFVQGKGHLWDDDNCEKKLMPLCKNLADSMSIG